MAVEFPKKVEKWLEKPHFMIISTLRPDGTIQSTPVWYIYENGKFKISTTGDRVKYKNLTKDPRCTFVILDKDDPYTYVQVQAEVEDYTREGGYDFIDKETKRYMGKDKYPYEPERDADRVTFTLKPIRHNAVGFRE